MIDADHGSEHVALRFVKVVDRQRRYMSLAALEGRFWGCLSCQAREMGRK